MSLAMMSRRITGSRPLFGGVVAKFSRFFFFLSLVAWPRFSRARGRIHRKIFSPGGDTVRRDEAVGCCTRTSHTEMRQISVPITLGRRQPYAGNARRIRRKKTVGLPGQGAPTRLCAVRHRVSPPPHPQKERHRARTATGAVALAP